MSGRRFRASSWGAGLIVFAVLLLIFHRFGSFLLFFIIGGALLWYGRRQREAASEDGADGQGSAGAGDGPEAHADASESGPQEGVPEDAGVSERGDEGASRERQEPR